MNHRVVVTGMGCISALGNTLEESWANAVAGRSAIRSRTSRQSESNMPVYGGPVAEIDLPAPDVIGQVLNLHPKEVARLDPISLFALYATKEALGDAQLTPHSEALEDAAIVFGVSVGGLHTIDATYHRTYGRGANSVNPFTVPKLMTSAPPSQMSLHFGIKGLTYAVASACASSSNAMTEAYHLIKSGRAQRVIVGGSDSQLTYVAWLSWKSLGALATETCRPFCATRNGMTMGEGASVLVFESLEAAEQRGISPYAEIIGAGATADAHHLTKPHGEMALKAVRQAYADSGLDMKTPVLVNAHGTGTVLNDRIESEVLAQHFEGRLNDNAVIATKSLHGHMIGATASMEMILGIQALNHGIAPKIGNHQQSDADIPLNLVLQDDHQIDYEYMLSNSFAFGGLNSSILVQRMAA